MLSDSKYSDLVVSIIQNLSKWNKIEFVAVLWRFLLSSSGIFFLFVKYSCNTYAEPNELPITASNMQ